MSLFVEIEIIWPLDLAIALGRDDHLGAACGDPVGQMVGIVSLVGDGGLGLDALDQIMSESDVVALAGRAEQADRKAEGFGGGVDLGAQPAPRPAQALGIRPPLTLRAPAAC